MFFPFLFSVVQECKEGHTLMDNLVSFAEVGTGMCFLCEFPV